LRTDFNLQDAPDQDGLQWVVATPKAKDGPLQSVRVGFRPSGRGSELAELEILDSFGQRSVLTFSQLVVNTPLRSDAFVFKPPAGADVVQQ
jgi:outer membrane lipoprotein carrier protein